MLNDIKFKVEDGGADAIITVVCAGPGATGGTTTVYTGPNAALIAALLGAGKLGVWLGPSA